MGSLVRSLPTLFLMKLHRLKRTLGLGGMVVRRTGRVALTLSKKLGAALENFLMGKRGVSGMERDRKERGREKEMKTERERV